MKSKLGVSVGLIGAAIYFITYFGGFLPAVLLVGYVLLIEENEWLRRNAVKSLALYTFFALLIALIDIIPSVLSVLYNLLSVLSIEFSFSIIYSIIDVVVQVIDIIKTCVFLLLGVSAFTQGNVSIPFIDKIINEHF